MRLLPLIALGACALALAEHGRAQRYRHDLRHAQREAAEQARVATALAQLVRHQQDALFAHITRRQAEIARLRGLWPSHTGERPAWDRSHPTPEANASPEPL